jgi:phosphoenolpyruvate carboxykinase (ATP)
MKNGFTEIRAAAEVLRCASNVIYDPSISEIYDMTAKSINVVVSEVKIPAVAMEKLGLRKDQDKVIVSYSGQDTGRSAWARRLVHEADAGLRDKYARLAREADMNLMARPLIYTEAYVGKSERFMVKATLVVPKEWAKLALDFQANFIPVNKETMAVFNRRKVKLPDIKVVVFPGWTPDMVRDQKNNPIIPDLPRLCMLFDSEGDTAYLLGARYFGEVKKATLTLAWKAVVANGLGCGIHGSSKLLHVKGKSGFEDVVFITIGLSGSGKSTIGLSIHEGQMRKGESVKVANDDAVAVMFDGNVTVGFEEGCFNKTDDYKPGSYMLETLVTAEDVLTYRDEKGRIGVMHEDVFVGNGRCITYRPALKGASEDVNVPWPSYITLIMKEETLPPMMLVKDPPLIAALFMSLSTKPGAAENIPVEEMGKLKIIPGANPFIIYPMQLEADTVMKMIKTTGCKGLIFNTSEFYVDAAKRTKIPKEVTLSFYPKVARDEVEWEEYRAGLYLPRFDAEYADKFDPRRVPDKEGYRKLYNERMDQRIAFLKKLSLSDDFIKALEKLKL